MTTSRRRVLIGAAGLAAIAWSWQRFGVENVNLAFEPIRGLDGWRQARTGSVSLGGNATTAVFFGIGEESATPLPPEALCDTLYTSLRPGLPVAVFTDINCPNCRSLEAKLGTRREGLSIRYFQLPLLGPGSEVAARAAIASELLSGVPAEPPRNLRGSSLASVIRAHAERTGLETEELREEMDKPAVDARLAIHQGAAEALGIFGTPAMTIGRTLVIGDVPPETLDELLGMVHPEC